MVNIHEMPPELKCSKSWMSKRVKVPSSSFLLSNIKVTGNAEPEDIDLPETSVAFSRAATG